MIRTRLPSRRFPLSPKRHGQSRQGQHPARSDVQLTQKSYFMIKGNTNIGGEKSIAELHILISEFCMIGKKRNSRQAGRVQGHREGRGLGGLRLPDSFPLSPSPRWTGATSPFQDTQRPPEAMVLWGSGSWSPSARPTPVPGTQEVRVPCALTQGVGIVPQLCAGKRIWMENWEPASKILPFKTKPSVPKLSSLIEFNVSYYPTQICRSGKAYSA